MRAADRVRLAEAVRREAAASRSPKDVLLAIADQMGEQAELAAVEARAAEPVRERNVA